MTKKNFLTKRARSIGLGLGVAFISFYVGTAFGPDRADAIEDVGGTCGGDGCFKTLNLTETWNPALMVGGKEALTFDGQNRFTWGNGGTENFFDDPIIVDAYLKTSRLFVQGGGPGADINAADKYIADVGTTDIYWGDPTLSNSFYNGLTMEDGIKMTGTGMALTVYGKDAIEYTSTNRYYWGAPGTDNYFEDTIFAFDRIQASKQISSNERLSAPYIFLSGEPAFGNAIKVSNKDALSIADGNFLWGWGAEKNVFNTSVLIGGELEAKNNTWGSCYVRTQPAKCNQGDYVTGVDGAYITCCEL